jgi:hypothetical protein
MVIAGSGKPLLRLLKSGRFVFGQSNEQVQEGSRWIVNIYQLGHGWSCWVQTADKKKNELRGEIMGPVTEDKPDRPPPIDDTPYAEQYSFEAKCIDGVDAGTEVLYKVGSHGGKSAFDDLVRRVGERLNQPNGKFYPFPVLALSSTFYMHPKWGETWKPIFNFVGWANLNGELEPADALPSAVTNTPSPAPAAEGRAVKHKPALVAPAEPAESAPPVSTIQAHVGQRRRPSSR